MRKIEQQMLNAVHDGATWHNGNTSVSMHVYGEDTFPNVFLHGNHIATVANGKCVVNLETLRKWPTVTTKSRLRALGADLTTKNGAIYLNGVKV